ncbi:MAG: hypothetical protein HN904_00760 [Victivallales bacterium]|nr:hypothetical protein [Victivallales bacterium]
MKLLLVPSLLPACALPAAEAAPGWDMALGLRPARSACLHVGDALVGTDDGVSYPYRSDQDVHATRLAKQTPIRKDAP